MKHLLSLFAINRLGIFILALFALNLAGVFGIAPKSGDISPFNFFHSDHEYVYTEPTNPALDMWSVWDTKFYVSIVEEGYSTQAYPFTQRDNKGFLPAYPVLLWFFSTFLFFGNIHVAGIVLSNIFLILALFFILRLISTEPKLTQVADKKYVWWYVLLFPTSYYLSAIYPESLFLLLGVLIFYLVHKRQFLAASILLSIACLTKTFGMFLIIPILIGLWTNRKDIPIYKILIYGGVAALLPCLYLYHMYTISGDPLAYIHIQEQFFWHQWQNPLITFMEAFNNKSTASLWNGSFILFGLFTLFASLKKLPISYSLYGLCCLLFPPLTGVLDGISRYMASLLVIPIALTILIKNPNVRMLLLILLATVQGFGIFWWVIGAGFAS